MKELNFIDYLENVEHYNKLYRDAVKKSEQGQEEEKKNNQTWKKQHKLSVLYQWYQLHGIA